MPRIVHFEFCCDDPERAAKFYTAVFGWKIAKWEGPMEYWLVETGPKDTPGIDGGLMRRPVPESSTYNTIDVPSVDEFIAKITANGGKVVKSKEFIPGVGWFAYCADTEGNVFGIMEGWGS